MEALLLLGAVGLLACVALLLLSLVVRPEETLEEFIARKETENPGESSMDFYERMRAEDAKLREERGRQLWKCRLGFHKPWRFMEHPLEECTRCGRVM